MNAPGNLLITGRPRVGKTTLIKYLAGLPGICRTAGFYTEEIREKGARTGFALVGLDDRRGLLAHRDLNTPWRVGRYRVDVKGFEAFLKCIPVSEGELIIIDEIGKMECFSDLFCRFVLDRLDAPAPCIATIALHGSPFIEGLKRRTDCILIEMTTQNRDSLYDEIPALVRSMIAAGEK